MPLDHHKLWCSVQYIAFVLVFTPRLPLEPIPCGSYQRNPVCVIPTQILNARVTVAFNLFIKSSFVALFRLHSSLELTKNLLSLVLQKYKPANS